MRLLGIDPGKMTGYAIYDTDTQEALHLSMHNHDPKGHVDHFNSLCWRLQPNVVIYERFIPRWGQKFDLDGVYLIGALQATGRELVGATPSQHKALVKDAALNPIIKRAGEKIGAGHSRDALRLCLWFAASRMKDVETLKLLQTEATAA